MKTIVRVAWSNNKKNKTRSILIMAAVFLSSVLLTVICTFASWLLRSEKANADYNYGSHYGTFRDVKESQLREIRRHGEFSKIGLMAQAGIFKMEGRVSFLALDQGAREFSHIDRRFSEGSYPQKEDEIAAQREFFEKNGYEDLKVGDTVTLEYRRDLQQKYEPRVFTVSGILKSPEDAQEQQVFLVCASNELIQAQYEPEEAAYTVAFRLGEDVAITYDNAEDVIRELAKSCGIEEKKVSVNGRYLLYTLNTGAETLVSAGVIGFMVILFSVMIIYNIFQVGIVQNIREYGKIRALGATKKQMRRLIYQEGLSIAVCSIPPGVVTGAFLSWASALWIMRQGNIVSGEERIMVSVISLPHLLLAAALALLTVVLALRTPMKTVAAISPIDALHYTESTGRPGAGFRKGRKRISVYALAAANIAANKKRTAMTIVTMGLSCVLFVVVANCLGNMDEEYEARKNVEYGRFQIELQYSDGDTAYPENNLDAILKNNPLNHTLQQQILALDGVTGIKSRNILASKINGEKSSIAVFDEESFEQAKQANGSVSGEVDYQEGKKQDAFYYGWSYYLEENGYQLGQALTAELENGTETAKANGILPGSFGSISADFVITEETYNRMGFSSDSPGWLWVDCEPEHEQTVRTELERLLDGTEHVMITAYAQEVKKAKASIRSIKSGCYLFLVILGMIGFMNLANTMILNIITKKQEYGILQAVGMTNRQLNASLQLQGMLMSAGTVLVAVAVGLPVGYACFRYGKEITMYGLSVYRVPVAEIGCMVVGIGLLQAGLSYLLSRNLKKESLVERIRYQE